MSHLHPSRRFSRLISILPYIAIFLAALFIASHVVPIFEWLDSDLFPRNRHTYRYPYLIDMFRSSFVAGHWYPRWLPDLGGGYGIPTFMFYPAGYWFLTLPISLLVDNPVLTYYLSLVIIPCIAGVGMYKLARLQANIGWATTCGLLFMFSPHFVSELFGGSMAQMAGTAFTPWALYFMLQLHHHAGTSRFIPPLAGWVVVTTCMMYTHHFAVFWYGVVSLPLAIMLLVQSSHRKQFFILLLQGALYILILTAPYWLSILLHHSEVTYGRAMDGLFVTFSRSLGHLYNYTIYAKLGALQFLLACAALICNLSSKRPQAMPVFICIMVCVLLFLQTQWGAILRREYLPFLYIVQGPYRCLVFCAVLLVWMASYLRLPRWFTEHSLYKRHALIICGVMAVSVASISLLQRDFPRIKLRSYEAYASRTMNSWDAMTHSREFEPHAARRIKKQLPVRNHRLPLLQAGCSNHLDLTVDQTGEPHMLRAVAKVTEASSAVPACIIINQRYMPGWRVQVNGQDIDFTKSNGENQAHAYHDAAGRIQVFLPNAGTYRLQAWYDGARYANIRNGLMLVLFSLCLLWSRRVWKKTKHSSANL